LLDDEDDTVDVLETSDSQADRIAQGELAAMAASQEQGGSSERQSTWQQ